MTPSAKLYFEKYNVRQLIKPNITRDEFNKSWAKKLEMIKSNAEKEFTSKTTEEEKQQTFRVIEKVFFASMGRKYSYFLAVHILKQEWMDTDYCFRLCCDVDQNKWKSNLWVIAREHLKSTVITGLSTLREILENPNLTYCLLSFTPDTASAFLRIIRSWIEGKNTGSKFLRYIYNDVLWEDPTIGYEYDKDGNKVIFTWNKSEITVKRTIECKEPTISTKGIEGGSITGSHFSRLIFDDAETADSVNTPENIERIYQNITNLFNAGQTEDLKFVMVGTFYAREDTYCKLLFNGIVKEAVVQSCWEEQDIEGVYYSKEILENKKSKMTPQVWATQMECDPSMSSSNSFKPEWVYNNRWTVDDGWDDMTTFAIVDPAGTPTNKSDYTAIITFSLNSYGNIYIRDIIRDKLTLDEKYFKLLEVNNKYHPLRILYEKVGMQADIYYIREQMDKYKVHFPIEEYTTTKNKIQKISNMIPHVRGGIVIWPQSCWHRNWQGQVEDMLDSTIQFELLAFPTGIHDDAIDAISTIVAMNDAKVFETPYENHSNIYITNINNGNYISYDPHKEFINEIFNMS